MADFWCNGYFFLCALCTGKPISLTFTTTKSTFSWTGFGRVMFVLEGAATRYRRSQFYDNPGLFFVQFDKCIYWDEEQRQMLLTEGKKRKL